MPLREVMMSMTSDNITYDDYLAQRRLPELIELPLILEPRRDREKVGKRGRERERYGERGREREREEEGERERERERSVSA